MNIMWFRRDLRLHDNPALHQAMSAGPTCAVYCLSQAQWDVHKTAHIQRELILAQLIQLEKELAKMSVPLIILNTERFSNIPKQLTAFIKKYKGQALFFNFEYELNETRLSEKVDASLAEHGIAVRGFHDQCLIAPGEIVNKQSQPYQVFTAFKKAYLSEFGLRMREMYGKPKSHIGQKLIAVKSNLSPIKEIKSSDFNHVDILIGEKAAHEQLEVFCKDVIADYKTHRDFPAINGTSKLSAYLAVGILSVRQCWHSADFYRHQLSANAQEGIDTWISELIWRDFYRHFIYFYPELCKGKAFKAKTDHLPWKYDDGLFNAWKAGKTGYPIVDAAMRQLNETGWMHNRLRMVVAMFLTKHLFLDWRLGEAYFMEKLVDGDFASNNGGWQWSASTGVDAAPYFRIFNPIRQSERFDTQGVFLRQYLPELRSLDDKSIHMPSTIQAQALGYPLPIVDHSVAVKSTKEKFKALDEVMDPNTNRQRRSSKELKTTGSKSMGVSL